MTSLETTIDLCGETLLATTAGAIYWPARKTIVVADLHFEKGSSFARRGVMLPPYDTRATLRRLRTLCDRFAPSMIVSLGDAFHDAGADARVDADDAALLASLMKGRRWVWVLGNHDPAPPARFAGEACEEMRLGALVFRHEPTPGAARGEIAGHLHPCARVRTDGRTQRRRCFASDGARMILPAFGAYTGGLNILDEAYDGLFGAFHVWVMGARGVYPFASSALLPDAQASARRAAG